MMFGEMLAGLKLPIKTLVALCLVSGMLSFLPNTVLEQLGLNLIIMRYKGYVGLIFIVTVVICLVHAGASVCSFLKPWLVQASWIRIHKKRLHSLTPQEKELLMYYIANQTRCQQINIINGIAGSLVRERIIIQACHLGMGGSFAYELQPWAWEYFNKHPELLK